MFVNVSTLNRGNALSIAPQVAQSQARVERTDLEREDGNSWRMRGGYQISAHFKDTRGLYGEGDLLCQSFSFQQPKNHDMQTRENISLK